MAAKKAKPQRGTIKLSWDKKDSNVAIVTISNPSKANAISLQMLQDLEGVVEELGSSRAIVLTGDGKKHFSAGADINSWAPMTPEQFARDWIRYGMSVFDELSALPGCVVAAIQGACMGGGLELALRADVRLCSTSARFAFPETGIGAIPGWKGGLLLSSETGKSLAAELILCGRELKAKDALASGLVSGVYKQAELQKTALKIARQAAKRSSVANASAKALMVEGGKTIEAHMKEGSKCKGSKDGREGLMAFSAKRKPKF